MRVSNIQSFLLKHKRTILQGVKYQCDQCEYEVGQHAGLRKHKRRKHLSLNQLSLE